MFTFTTPPRPGLINTLTPLSAQDGSNSFTRPHTAPPVNGTTCGRGRGLTDGSQTLHAQIFLPIQAILLRPPPFLKTWEMQLIYAA